MWAISNLICEWDNGKPSSSYVNTKLKSSSLRGFKYFMDLCLWMKWGIWDYLPALFNVRAAFLSRRSVAKRPNNALSYPRQSIKWLLAAMTNRKTEVAIISGQIKKQIFKVFYCKNSNENTNLDDVQIPLSSLLFRFILSLFEYLKMFLV